ncbi:MAG: hypothetical protein GY755_04310 [Chloroflexi bacterium]|nr:hypothetical protein [Chloroflexota bacterium]
MKKNEPPYKKKASYQAHRRDFIWQILLPMLLVLVLVVIASVFTAMRPSATASLWADISTIWLLIPLLIFALITLVILAGLIYGMAKLLDITPFYTQKLYALICLLTEKIKNAADSSAKPIFFVEELSASIKSIFGRK